MLMALWIQKQALSIKTSTIGVGEEECERADAEKHDDFELSRISFFSFIVALNLMVRFLSNNLPPFPIFLPPTWRTVHQQRGHGGQFRFCHVFYY